MGLWSQCLVGDVEEENMEEKELLVEDHELLGHLHFEVKGKC